MVIYEACLELTELIIAPSIKGKVVSAPSPLLGIRYGMQAMGYLMGGRVTRVGGSAELS